MKFAIVFMADWVPWKGTGPTATRKPTTATAIKRAATTIPGTAEAIPGAC